MVNVLAALANNEDKLVFKKYFGDAEGFDARLIDDISQARKLFKLWIPDVVFLNPEVTLGNGPFSGSRMTDQTRAKDADKVESSVFIKYLKSVNGNVNLIFVSSDSKYMFASFAVRASGFVTSPLTPASIAKEMGCLRYRVEERDVSQIDSLHAESIEGANSEVPADNGEENDESAFGSGLSIRAFGSFEVFFDGEPVRFRHAKTKEMLAYLIDRYGAMVSNGELVSVLWEDGDAKRHAPYLRAMKLDLQNTFKDLGVDDVIARERGGIACCVSGIDCDYFEYLRSSGTGNVEKMRARDYRGEYMSQYEWADATNARLLNLW